MRSGGRRLLGCVAIESHKDTARGFWVDRYHITFVEFLKTKSPISLEVGLVPPSFSQYRAVEDVQVPGGMGSDGSTLILAMRGLVGSCPSNRQAPRQKQSMTIPRLR